MGHLREWSQSHSHPLGLATKNSVLCKQAYISYWPMNYWLELCNTCHMITTGAPPQCSKPPDLLMKKTIYCLHFQQRLSHNVKFKTDLMKEKWAYLQQHDKWSTQMKTIKWMELSLKERLGRLDNVILLLMNGLLILFRRAGYKHWQGLGVQSQQQLTIVRFSQGSFISSVVSWTFTRTGH